MSELDDLAADPRLGTFRCHVIDAATGAAVFDRDGAMPSPTASALKVLTSAAALDILGLEYRATTRVVQGDRPEEIVLVGGGDVTLSRLPSGTPSFYPGVAHLDELAQQVMRSRADSGARVPIRRLVLDASLFSGPLWLETWDELEERVTDGSMPYVTALQVDGDRDDPRAAYTPRSDDPVRTAGREFAPLIGGDIELAIGTAPRGAPVLGQVDSPSVAELVPFGLLTSDNVLMEMLARLCAIAAGTGADFAAVQPAVLAALRAYRPDPVGIRLADGSGLSELSRVPPRYLAEFMACVWRRNGRLGVIADGLPQSGPGATGTLAGDRFIGPNAVVGDAVRAKTGWIIGAYTMAGYLRSRRGRVLAFAVFALGDVGHSARQAIDSFVTGLYLDGDASAQQMAPDRAAYEGI